MENSKTRWSASLVGDAFRRLLLVVAVFTLGVAAQAQNLNVSGNVVDENDDPVIGASVLIGGTSQGVATDIDGNFSLKNVPSKGELVVNFVGYNTQTVKVEGRTNINIKLSLDSEMLDEVVVVGYGTQKKSDVTGALSHVGSKELQSRPVSNAFEALQGKAAGVDITTSERPGTVGEVRIRGERSLKAGNTPLYVVDGVPLLSGSGIETLNPRDIESVDILKDASATAIYGSRGANGVILITTKSGKPGQFSLNYSGSVTFQNLVDRNPSMSAAEYIDYRRWAAYNSDPTKYADPRNPTRESDDAIFGIIDDATAYANVMNGWAGGTWNPAGVTDYDWTGQALRTGVVNEHTVSASGGTDKLSAFGSFGFLNNSGTQRGQEYNRYTARLGMNITPVKWMEINMNINASREEQDYGMSGAFAPSSTNKADGLYELYKKSYRWALPYDADGNRIKYPGGDNQCYNPIEEWKHNISNRETWRFLGSFSATLKLGEIWAPLKGLNYRISFGPDYRQYRKGDYIDDQSAYN
ncbi:MAG: SusC/RagA family TonB-linked outer membrane protein, partial [Duncaniella sp.]|nr:SusC/RagA family TonB-linked outer membrane protein [Duncaniella sp.]